MKTIVASLTALVFLAGVARAADDDEPPLVSGMAGVIKFMAPGCKSIEEMEKLRTIAKSGDTTAYGKILVQTMAAGECTPLKSGTMVYVDDTSLWHSALCVRPQGETDCWWTPQHVVKKK